MGEIRSSRGQSPARNLAKRVLIGFAVALCALAAGAPADAVVIATDPSVIDSIPGVATFSTFGDTMDGMLIKATFAGGFTETIAWADTGAGAGGVSGTGWSLTLSGDTFFADWNFTNTRGEGLLSLRLDGTPGLTVFDRTTTFPDFGTPGSALGGDFVEDPTTAGTATYSHEVAIGVAAPVGDLWHILEVVFASGISGDWSFTQDTDNDIRVVITPEPATLAFLGVGLIAVGVIAATRRRR